MCVGISDGAGTLVGTVGSIIGRRKMLEDRHEVEIQEIKEFMASKRYETQ